MSTGQLKHSTGYRREPANHPFRQAHPFAPVRKKFLGAMLQETGDYEIDDSLVTIFDQLNEESCVSNGWTAHVMILLALEFKVAPAILSRQFLYWTARCLDNCADEDDGCQVVDGGQSLMTSGICLETLWPYAPAEVLVSPPETAFFQASQNLLKNYYAFTDTGTQLGADIEAAIRANHPVPFGADIGQELDNYQGASIDPNYVFTAPATPIGGHCQLITGVRYVNGARQWKVRNSWSALWGINGYSWWADSYVLGSASSAHCTATNMPALAA